VQTLLKKNHFLAMKEPILFVANYLGIQPPQLVRAMSTFRTASGGWLATVNETLMNTLPIEKGFLPILKTKVNRRPLIGMKRSDSQLWCYKTEGMAVWAILLHILFNVRMQFRDHWCKKLLENTKEFTLLLPISPTLEKCLAVCVIFRWEGRIWMKQFQEHHCQVMERVVIGKYYTFGQPSKGLMLGTEQ
jgi:hypothetical protein